MAGSSDPPAPALRTVFIDSNIGTHMAMNVSDADTVGDLKRKVTIEHSLCFPGKGHIDIYALKVRRKSNFYHLSDSMLVKSAFDGFSGTWFLYMDSSSACLTVTQEVSVEGHIKSLKSQPLEAPEQGCEHFSNCVGPAAVDAPHEQPSSTTPSNNHLQNSTFSTGLSIRQVVIDDNQNNPSDNQFDLEENGELSNKLMLKSKDLIAQTLSPSSDCEMHDPVIPATNDNELGELVENEHATEASSFDKRNGSRDMQVEDGCSGNLPMECLPKEKEMRVEEGAPYTEPVNNLLNGSGSRHEKNSALTSEILKDLTENEIGREVATKKRSARNADQSIEPMLPDKKKRKKQKSILQNEDSVLVASISQSMVPNHSISSKTGNSDGLPEQQSAEKHNDLNHTFLVSGEVVSNTSEGKENDTVPGGKVRKKLADATEIAVKKIKKSKKHQSVKSLGSQLGEETNKEGIEPKLMKNIDKASAKEANETLLDGHGSKDRVPGTLETQRNDQDARDQNDLKSTVVVIAEALVNLQEAEDPQAVNGNGTDNEGGSSLGTKAKNTKKSKRHRSTSDLSPSGQVVQEINRVSVTLEGVDTGKDDHRSKDKPLELDVTQMTHQDAFGTTAKNAKRSKGHSNIRPGQQLAQETIKQDVTKQPDDIRKDENPSNDKLSEPDGAKMHHQEVVTTDKIAKKSKRHKSSSDKKLNPDLVEEFSKEDTRTQGDDTAKDDKISVDKPPELAGARMIHQDEPDATAKIAQKSKRHRSSFDRSMYPQSVDETNKENATVQADDTGKDDSPLMNKASEFDGGKVSLPDANDTKKVPGALEVQPDNLGDKRRTKVKAKKTRHPDVNNQESSVKSAAKKKFDSEVFEPSNHKDDDKQIDNGSIGIERIKISKLNNMNKEEAAMGNGNVASKSKLIQDSMTEENQSKGGKGRRKFKNLQTTSIELPGEDLDTHQTDVAEKEENMSSGDKKKFKPVKADSQIQVPVLWSKGDSVPDNHGGERNDMEQPRKRKTSRSEKVKGKTCSLDSNMEKDVGTKADSALVGSKDENEKIDFLKAFTPQEQRYKSVEHVKDDQRDNIEVEKPHLEKVKGQVEKHGSYSHGLPGLEPSYHTEEKRSSPLSDGTLGAGQEDGLESSRVENRCLEESIVRPTASKDDTEDAEATIYASRFGRRTSSKSDRYRVAVRKLPGKAVGENLDDVNRKNNLLADHDSIFQQSGSESSKDGVEVNYSDATTQNISEDSCPSDCSEGTEHTPRSKNQAKISSLERGISFDGKYKDTDGNDIGPSESKSREKSLDIIFRSSQSYKKAKITASQSIVEESESQPIDMRPDSLADLGSQVALSEP